MKQEKAYRHGLRIKLHREEIIEDIKTEMILNNAKIIDLHNGIMYNYINDQSSDIISGIALDERVFIDNDYDTDVVSLQDLSTDQLIGVLEMIEEKLFDIDELLN